MVHFIDIKQVYLFSVKRTPQCEKKMKKPDFFFESAAIYFDTISGTPVYFKAIHIYICCVFKCEINKYLSIKYCNKNLVILMNFKKWPF
jgi:hypothetical protein